ncbi:Deoxyguanosinetriphosphate triphosphohydrolase [hydrothermal vent metagenome]|uniref:Deoxyguanosinetriphosphate triphosphohydrolase n=1 Tax=hydrothermal vent metagenome TaxID=652676 RepID=A0A3B0S3U0_9ZZZZ
MSVHTGVLSSFRELMNYKKAIFSQSPENSKGRFSGEQDSYLRSCYQHDRDRIIHSSAFRRLKHKTQVFVYHEGDHFRTRLTHSLEVAQVARTMARYFGLDEDLTESLALAHDLGHTPFGHAGEEALDNCMEVYGGFDHNAQALRIVTRLEQSYAAFDGLNLTWETLEGLVKHNGPLVNMDGSLTERYEVRGIPVAISEFAHANDLELATFASAEAQIAAISDDIAYNAHDIDDGLRAKLFDVIDLGDNPLVGGALSKTLEKWPKIEKSRLIHETVRSVITLMVNDVIAHTEKQIEKYQPQSPDDVRNLSQLLVDFSPQMHEKNKVLQSFLMRRMYHHKLVSDNMARARRVIRDLFEAFMADPSRLPEKWRADNLDEDRKARKVCDYIAGMTDRYALDQHKAIFDLDPLFR